MNPYELEYGVATTIRHVELIATDGTTFTSSLTAGDVKVRIDGGTANNIGTLPSAVGSSYVVTLTAAELQGAQIAVEFVDQDGPAFITKTLPITTILHPSAYDPAGVVLAGTAVTGANTDAGGFELVNGQTPEEGQDVEFTSGAWKGRRVIASISDLGGGSYRAVYDRSTDAVVTGRYRITGGSLPTSIEEFQSGLATTGDTDALATAIATVDTVVDAILVDTGTTLDGKIDTIGTNVDTLVASDILYKKATAVTAFAFYMELTAGGPATSITVTVQVSKDGGAFNTVAGAVTEISDGWYEVDLSGTEMNADEIAFKATGTGCVQRNIKIRTQS